MQLRNELHAMKNKTSTGQSSLAWMASLGLSACALVAGCNVGPKYHQPSAPTATAPAYKESQTPIAFRSGDGWKVAQPSDAMLRGKWWEIFQDPELNALEEKLNVDNQNIKVSFENYMAARALIGEAKAQYWPTVTTSPAWSRVKTSGNLGKSSTANAGSTTSTWSFPFDVSWTPDFFGKIKNQVREDQYAAQVSAADLENERLLEQASLAEYFFEIRGQDELQRILNDTVKHDQESLDLTQKQYDSGVGGYISVVQAKATLKSAHSTALNIGVARAQYEHAIAMLIGVPASDFTMPVKPLIAAPPAVPVGVPAQLLERRPDISSAERTVAEANATIGIGYGAFFPDITLSATGGFEASAFKHWFDWPSRFWSIGPSVSETIFNGWLYRAALQQYTALYNADVATYRQSVLVAFQQVEDYLAATRILSQQVIVEKQAVDASGEALKLEEQRYKSGIDPYIDVVTAQNTLLSDQQTLTTAQIQESIAAVELIQALGGGWDRSQLPSEQQVSVKPKKADYVIQK